MKAKIFTLCALFALSMTSVKAEIFEKHKKETVTFLVSMTCENCQKRIESNIPYEKGVTDLKVDLPKKLVTIEYRADKTTAANLRAAIKDMGFTATPFKTAKKGNETQKTDKK